MFKFTANVGVYEDSYTKGEGAQVNDWTYSKTYKKLDWDSIKDFIQNELCYTFNKDYVDICDNRLCYCLFVDNDNVEASNSEIELWKENKMTLYSANISIRFELISEVENIEDLLF